MLGHSSISITPDTHSNVMPGLGEVAASAMEDALKGQRSDRHQRFPCSFSFLDPRLLGAYDNGLKNHYRFGILR
jgi:hypothetical protein